MLVIYNVREAKISLPVYSSVLLVVANFNFFFFFYYLTSHPYRVSW